MRGSRRARQGPQPEALRGRPKSQPTPTNLYSMLAAPLYSLLCSFHMHWSVTSCQSPFSLLADSADSGLRSRVARNELHTA